MSSEPSRFRGVFTNRFLVISAAVLWLVAVALATAYAWPHLGVGGLGEPDPAEAVVATGWEENRDPSAAEASSGPTLPTDADPPAGAAASTSTTAVVTTSLPTTTTTSPPPSTTTTTAPPPPLFIAAGGDVLGDRGVARFIDKNGGEAVFAAVRPFLEPAHLAFVNLESPLSDKGTRATWKEYTFRSRAALIDGLISAGIDMVSLANNHTVDYGHAALLDTIARLDKAGVAHAGAGADRSEAEAPAILISPAGTVAFLAVTAIIPGGFAATDKQPGVFATWPNWDRVLSSISSAAERVDYVVVSIHWGVEYTPHANGDQRRMAHQMVDAGADLILGHHPHVLQGLELYKDRLIAYSLGDFVFDHYSRATGEAFVLQVHVAKEGPPSFVVIPVYADDTTGVPDPVYGKEAAVILDRLAKVSAALGLEVGRDGDRAVFGDPAVYDRR